MTNVLSKIFGDNIRGLSLAKNNLTRDLPYSKTVLNVAVNPYNEIEKRNGFILSSQYSYSSGGEDVIRGLNSLLFKNSSGVVTEEVLCWLADPEDSNLLKMHRRLGNTKLTIGYTGVGSATFSLGVSNGAWLADLTVDGSSVSGWPNNYGNGLEVSPSVVGDLVTDIAAETDFTCVATSGPNFGRVPIAALGPVEEISLSSDLSINFDYYEPVYTQPEDDPYDQNFSDETFTPPNMTVLNKIVYWGRDQQGASSETDTNRKFLFKYDGNQCYRAGFPPIEVDTASEGADGTTLTAGDYLYKVRIKHVDYRGNIVSSDFRASGQLTVAVDRQAHTYTVPITDGGSGGRAAVTLSITLHPDFDDDGFLLHDCVVNGAQTDSAITVDSGHNIVVGDILWLHNSGTLQQATVTAVAATEVTLDQSVTVADNAIMSTALVEVFRTISDGALFYKVAETPYDNTNGTDYTDSTSDSSLQEKEELLTPLIVKDVPPAGRYVTEHQGLLVIAGVPGREQEVFVSDLSSPEYVPDSNTVDVSASGKGTVTGIASDGERLYVFKERSYVIVHGNLKQVDPGEPPDTYVETKSLGVGAVAHDTIQRGTGFGGEEVVYFLSYNGPQRLVDGVLDVEFGSRLSPYFKALVDTDTRIVTSPPSGVFTNQVYFKHCTAIYDPLRKRYVLAIAIEEGIEGSYLFSSDVKLFVYEELLQPATEATDRIGDRWYEWTSSLDALSGVGGMCIADDRLLISGTYNPTGTTCRSFVCKEIRSIFAHRFADNVAAITARWHTPWEAFSNPSVNKLLAALRLWRDPDNFTVGGTYTVRSYRDLVSLADTSNAFSSFNLNFSSSSTVEAFDDFIEESAKLLLVEIENSTIHENMHFSAIELSYNAEYEGGYIEEL